MSYTQNGDIPYVNGGYSRGEKSRNDDLYQEGGPVGGSRFHRPGGYGGFLNDDPPVAADAGPTIRSQQGLHAEGSNGRYARGGADAALRGYGSGERSRSRDRGRGDTNVRAYGSGPGARQIEEVLQHIEESWEILTKDECVAVHVALQLDDSSSLGRGSDKEDFQQTSQQLQQALKAIVNEHHQGFNSSIGTFHKIQSSIHASQARVRALKDSIHDAKTSLMVPKPELKGMGISSQSYAEIIHILGQIENLQAIPEQLDARISEKHFLLAVDLLQDALRLIRRSDMENIGALTDLRIYFSNQETSIIDILIEELHDHVYLKSPYCQDRWKPSGGDASVSILTENAQSWGRPLHLFLERLDTSLPLEDDASINPETDSFHYIHLILESLNRLGSLDAAVDTIEQRLPVELFKILEKTNKEVDLRHSSQLHNLRTKDQLSSSPQQHRVSKDNVFNDLLGTLYSKFEAIAEGHRVVHDIIIGITKREGLGAQRGLAGSFKEMWKLYQSEMRSLLHDYLATDGDAPSRLGRIQNIDANRVFKLAEIDKRSTDLATEQEDLNQILKASVPGLVSKSQRRSGASDNRNNTVDGPVTGHKLLAEPNVFNISLLLPPSLSFLQRLKEIVPPDSEIAMSTLTSFLDDFLVNVFHPQLEETVTELCTGAFVEMDAFQADPQWAQHARKPIFKGTSTFFALIYAFCELLQSIPQDPAFTQLLVSQIVAYYERCSDWYKSLVARPRNQQQDDSQLKPAAAIAENGDLREATAQLFNDSDTPIEEVAYAGMHLLLSAHQEQPFQARDIISGHVSVSSLCVLYTSMTWLASRLSSLGHVVSEPSATSTKSAQARRWTFLNLRTTSTIPSSSTTPQLPLNSSTAPSFDQTLSSMRNLALTALLTLHLDIRAGMIHMLSRTLSAPYLLAQPTQEPEPSVLTLNNDLLSFDDYIKAHIDTREHRFVINGLASLIDTTLVSLTPKQITAMNADGCARMQLNILVLQQNLKAVEPKAVLTRSVEYFDLFTHGASGIVALAKERGKDMGFTLEELKGLVELSYSEDLKSEGREGAVAARKGLSSALMELSEVLWDT